MTLRNALLATLSLAAWVTLTVLDDDKTANAYRSPYIAV